MVIHHWPFFGVQGWKVYSVSECKSQTYIWRSGYCYLNKWECNLSRSKDDSLVERVTKNDSWNNGDRHKIHEIFLINCFVIVIAPVWKTVHSSAMTQIKAHLMEKNIATNCSQVVVPVLAGWTKKSFGHYAVFKLCPLDHQDPHWRHVSIYFTYGSTPQGA